MYCCRCDQEPMRTMIVTERKACRSLPSSVTSSSSRFAAIHCIKIEPRSQNFLNTTTITLHKQLSWYNNRFQDTFHPHASYIQRAVVGFWTGRTLHNLSLGSDQPPFFLPSLPYLPFYFAPSIILILRSFALWPPLPDPSIHWSFKYICVFTMSFNHAVASSVTNHCLYSQSTSVIVYCQ